ncbi:putative zinc transporter protein DDB_G0282067 [Dictyostelium discoideum] [Rhizoctonia solani]|uniref:Putative zinc transporter protein DDB_G0282067 [Dictyostelium discoideum] n=1 Tax=Rhizoctonia solani TaxID=456999 RepID=A0A0K6GE44_9AGAM|nr:putative zinc transporter protein DDB_G0282067 [Dictyostelium discoideum] [Rhizoctonia solani]
MLNDVLSLIVALYAIKATSGASAKYSYGWHRAEILAALINGVFLLALCFSIFMEAIERFFSTPEISNPRLVVIVGSLGLASNILGLFLFHEHGHDHPTEKHESSAKSAPAPVKPVSNNATESTPLLISSPSASSSSSEASTPRPRADSSTSLIGHPAHTRAALVAAGEEVKRSQARPVRKQKKVEDDSIVRSAPVAGPFAASRGIHAQMNSQGAEDRMDVVVDPSTALADDECEDPAGDCEGPHAHAHPVTPYAHDEHEHNHDHSHAHSHEHGHSHGHGHGHGHGSMNMRALVLHVLGDALGNVGVIATGLIIWLSDWKLKYYCDPIISLVITVIIFSSALPLVKSTSSILLQAVPPSLSLPHLRRALNKTPGVLAVHELHVWQLSEAKSVASVHVRVARPMEFMAIAARVRGVLHAFGVHSSTIQPEYADVAVSAHVSEEELGGCANEGCLAPCGLPGREQCAPEDGCCPPTPGQQTLA